MADSQKSEVTLQASESPIYWKSRNQDHKENCLGSQQCHDGEKCALTADRLVQTCKKETAGALGQKQAAQRHSGWCKTWRNKPWAKRCCRHQKNIRRFPVLLEISSMHLNELLRLSLCFPIGAAETLMTIPSLIMALKAQPGRCSWHFHVPNSVSRTLLPLRSAISISAQS